VDNEMFGNNIDTMDQEFEDRMSVGSDVEF